jgi:hypothetical protein
MGAVPARARLEASGIADPVGPCPGQHPEGSQALPGYVWLDMPEKARHVPERELEFTEDPE